MNAPRRLPRRLPTPLAAAAAISLVWASAATAADSVYWGNEAGNTISRISSDGSGETVGTGTATVDVPAGLALDAAAGKLYWANANANGNTISVARLDGSGGSDLGIVGAAVSSPTGVAVGPAAGRVSWANTGANRISYAALDGSGGGDLATGAIPIEGPAFPVLLREPIAAGAPALSAAGNGFSCSRGSWAADVPESFLARAPAGFGFEWLLGGAVLPVAAGTATITPAAAGSYRCRVTAANYAGSVEQLSPSAAVGLALSLTARRSQSAGLLRVSVGCGALPCRVRLSGFIRLPQRLERKGRARTAVRRLNLRPRSAAVAAGGRRQIRVLFKANRRSVKRIARLLRQLRGKRRRQAGVVVRARHRRRRHDRQGGAQDRPEGAAASEATGSPPACHRAVRTSSRRGKNCLLAWPLQKRSL